MNSYPLEISIPPQKLKNQNPIEVKNAYIKLYENYLLYHLDFIAEEPQIKDDEYCKIVNEIENYFYIIAKKNAISGIEISHNDTSCLWGVFILVQGFSQDLKIYCKSKKRATEIGKLIEIWLIT